METKRIRLLKEVYAYQMDQLLSLPPVSDLYIKTGKVATALYKRIKKKKRVKYSQESMFGRYKIDYIKKRKEYSCVVHATTQNVAEKIAIENHGNKIRITNIQFEE